MSETKRNLVHFRERTEEALADILFSPPKEKSETIGLFFIVILITMGIETSPLVLLVAILTYGSILQFSTMFNWRPWVCSIIAVAVPFIFTKTWSFIMANYDPQFLWISWVGDVITLVLQFCVGLFVFFKYDQMDDSVKASLLAVFGAFIIYVTIPSIF